jgi:hypothetical protein
VSIPLILVARILVNPVSILCLWTGETRILNREDQLLFLEPRRRFGEETVSLQHLTLGLMLTQNPAIGGEPFEIQVKP